MQNVQICTVSWKLIKRNHFSKAISQVKLSINLDELQPVFRQILLDTMVLHVNVLHPITITWFSRKMKPSLIIAIKIDVLLRQFHLNDKLVEPHCFLCDLYFCNIFSFHEWQKDALLKSRCLTNAAICKSETIPSRWFALVQVSSMINIHIFQKWFVIYCFNIKQ